MADPRFGEQLRRERERRGLPIEAINAVTKVPVRHILSLEAGAFSDLPGGIFRRGFLRSYLRALNLEESAWMPRFEESCRNSGLGQPEETAWTIFAENVKNTRSKRRRRARPYRLWGAAFAAVLAGCFVLVLIGVAHRIHSSHAGPGNRVKSWLYKLTK